jgi:RNA polymerase sporulation-specific sigma factor
MINKLIGGFVGSFINSDEAYQEACIAFHRAVTTYDLSKSEGITFGLYSRICVYRRLCDFVDKRSKEAEICIVDPDEFAHSDDIEEAILMRERTEKYLECVRGILSEYEFNVFTLYIDGYSTREISHRLMKNEKSVENAKARAMKHIRDEGDALAKIFK